MEDLFYFKKSFRSCPNVSHFAPAIHSAPDVLPPCPPSLRSGQALKGGKSMAKKLVPGGWRVEKVSSVQNQGVVSEITK